MQVKYDLEQRLVGFGPVFDKSPAAWVAREVARRQALTHDERMAELEAVHPLTEKRQPCHCGKLIHTAAS